jgi:hypothetical protein
VNDLHYAVVVGINRYPGIRDLRYARTDAEAFRDWLVSPDGGRLPQENVVLVTATEDQEQTFTSALDARPTRTDVDRALRRINDTVRRRVSENAADWDRTRLYFYVSGHGIAPPTSQGALLMADAERDVLGESIELALYGQWYEGCGVFREVVIFADCCRERVPGAPPGRYPPFNLCSKPYGRITRLVGYATGLGELAFEPFEAEDPDKERGFFTRALLDALERAPVDPAAGGITSETLGPYVRQTVEELTKEAPNPQLAKIVVEAGEPILLRPAQASERARWKVTITLPAGFAGEAELLRGDRSLVERRSAAAGPWELQLEEGFYGVFPAGGAQPLHLFQVVGGDIDVRL